MSNQERYDQSQGYPSNNPWADAQGQGTGYSQQQQQGFNPPSGPPPGENQETAGTFKETDFVPEAERGEQREAMEQFELSNSSNESQYDKDVAQLQTEFPGIDGSLVAAIYGDGGMGAA